MRNALFGVLTPVAGCAQEKAVRHHFLSVSAGGPKEEVIRVLSAGGIRCRPGMSSLGSVVLYVEGAHADPSRARELVRDGVKSRG
jgi:hypothetical protein